jgi:KipI family sensor histidine kinase inhibitor
VTPPPRVLPVGDAALSVDFGDRLDPLLAARVRALDAALRADPIEGVHECVPTCRALLVIFDPERTAADALGDELRRRTLAPPAPEAPRGRHVVPVCYDGADLDDVARACGLQRDDVVGLHAGRDYEALMLGFLPGFAYLGLLPPELELPRRATPRPRVPAGSVAIAGRQTGVYPAASPGGWHLVGRTATRFFDPWRDPPARVQAGDRVRFEPVAALGDEAAPAWPEPAPGAAFEVLDGGWRTSVQDAGRLGLRRQGVPWSGALDAPALARANRAAGNPDGAAGLECELSGPRLLFLAPCVFAWDGADLDPRLERSDLRAAWRVPRGLPVRARPGNVLAFAERRAGLRAYVAFAGGVDAPVCLGSRATDLSSGFGGWAGRALRAGDRLGLAGERSGAASRASGAVRDQATLRVILGPQDDHFDPEALAAFFATTWTVGPTSDRVGCRLVGPRLAHAGPSEIVSDGMVPGCVQVPPDGQPIVSLSDGPTTGGYPKIATVVRADLPLLAQLVPGEGCLRFVRS